MEIKKKIRLARIAYLNYIEENAFVEYIDLHRKALNVVLNGKLLRNFNDKKVFKLESDNEYILVTLTDDERITNIIEKQARLGGVKGE